MRMLYDWLSMVTIRLMRIMWRRRLLIPVRRHRLALTRRVIVLTMWRTMGGWHRMSDGPRLMLRMRRWVMG
jgi:hypothetical protein